MAGNWEPLPHTVRAGLATVREVETWHAERTEETARKLKDIGVNLVITNLHKGFGLKAEKEYIDATKRFVEAAHRHGIRVGGYIGATVYTETMLAEEPGAKDWLQMNEWGEPVYYGSQTHRTAYCRNHPGLQAFVQKVMRLGIQELKLDLIHFDQMSWWPEPESCRCRYCREDFRRFLLARYSGRQAKMRFGFERLDGVIPPAYPVRSRPIGLAQLNDPLMQEWAYWRTASMASRLAEYDNYAYSLNPEVAVDGNPFFTITSNYGFQGGTDLGTYLDHCDFMWSEEPAHASWTSDGRLISRIRTFKAVRAMGKSVFMYTGSKWGTQDPDSPPALRIAEAMAYNGANIGMVGNVTPEGSLLRPGAREYIDFFRGHEGLLASATPVTDVAVLRSFASMEFNPSRAIPSAMLVEQTLIQSRIPFGMVYDRHLPDLSAYKVLVLPNQDALSDEQMKNIRAFVSMGGGLVATEDTSMANEWRWTRDKFGLADLFGVETREAAVGPVRREYGKGRVVYLPRIEAISDLPAPSMNYSFGLSNWKLPDNYQSIAEAVRWAARNQISVSVEAPPSVVAELARTPEGMLLHLVNYNFREPTTNLNVRLRTSGPVWAVVVESPDAPPQELKHAIAEPGVVSFRVPKLQTYNLVVIRNGAPPS